MGFCAAEPFPPLLRCCEGWCFRGEGSQPISQLGGGDGRMNWEAIGAVGEILGAIGVIATLGYLAVQIRQNTKSNRQAAARSTLDTINRLNLVIVERPEIADLAVRGMADREKLDFNDSLRFHMLMMSTLLLYQEGFLN